MSFQSWTKHSSPWIFCGSHDFKIQNSTDGKKLFSLFSYKNMKFSSNKIIIILKFCQRLYSMGARKIIVANVGPIGCIPFQREINPSAGNGCVVFPNQLAQQFNTQLRSLVEELSANLEGSKFIYADVYRIVDDIIQNYSSYGMYISLYILRWDLYCKSYFIFYSDTINMVSHVYWQCHFIFIYSCYQIIKVQYFFYNEYKNATCILHVTNMIHRIELSSRPKKKIVPLMATISNQLFCKCYI